MGLAGKGNLPFFQVEQKLSAIADDTNLAGVTQEWFSAKNPTGNGIIVMQLVSDKSVTNLYVYYLRGRAITSTDLIYFGTCL